jgi:hypothetical protein
LINAGATDQRFMLPALDTGRWKVMISSAEAATEIGNDGSVLLVDRALMLLARRHAAEG